MNLFEAPCHRSAALPGTAPSTGHRQRTSVAGVLAVCLLSGIAASAAWGQARTTVDLSPGGTDVNTGTGQSLGDQFRDEHDRPDQAPIALSGDTTPDPEVVDRHVTPTLFSHTARGSTKAYPSPIIRYITWNGGHWTAKIENGRFVHSPRDGSRPPHGDTILNYRDWKGSHRTAKIEEDQFLIAYEGEGGFSDAALTPRMEYLNWAGRPWSARLAHDL